MRNRLAGGDIGHVMGWPQEEVQRATMESQTGQMFRAMLFTRIVPNLRKLGLITPRVREAFERLDIIKFEHLDPDEQDRRAGPRLTDERLPTRSSVQTRGGVLARGSSEVVLATVLGEIAQVFDDVGVRLGQPLRPVRHSGRSIRRTGTVPRPIASTSSRW